MPDFDQELDATGLNCPMPILKAKKTLATMNTGEVLHVIATDSGSLQDFESFSKQTGHELLEKREEEGAYHFYLRCA
ncbi:SirA family protein [Halorhodospira abdelmalekii]|uniref:sulfurtransferase TusA family protein n=1 Tax=Halorhodospira abdelmalekii TaxID=421629 RepID=UPI0019073511|nr:sulfurtransferase TusA family protein [Halorhodospira abdelmalekii]MBK1735491.1 SirA family protein [Halorhodospira abdelmalekii]